MRSSEAAELKVEPSDAGVLQHGGNTRSGPELVLSAPPTPRGKSSERLANLERLRIVAMLEIVTFHVGRAINDEAYRLPIIAGLGLPIFLLLNNTFNCTLSERMGTRAFLDAKVSKLVLPWLVWSGVYGVMVVAEKLRHHEPLSEAFSLWMIIGGTYEHLWFVPFALFGSVLIAALQARTRTVSHRRMAAIMLAAGLIVTLFGSWLLRDEGTQWPVVQWLFALPSPVLGFALGRVLLSRERALLVRLSGSLTLIGAASLALALVWSVPEMARRYALSLAVVSLIFLWSGRMDGLSRRLTPLLFGVYLTHPLLLRAYQGAHLPNVPVPLLGVLLFAVSALLVEVLRRTPLRRLV